MNTFNDSPRDESAARDAGDDQLDALLLAAFSDHPFGDDAVEAIHARVRSERVAAAAPAPVRAEPAGPVRFRGWVLSVAAAGLVAALGLSMIGSQVEEVPSSSAPSLAQAIGEAGQGLMRLDGAEQVQLEAGASVRVGERFLAVAQPATLRLADGTRLDVHADTELTFARDEDGGLRVVLRGAEGRVFCDVAKQKRAPFRVQARDLSVEVLGTRFVVEQGVRSSRVAVVEGRVAATTASAKEILGADDQAEAFLDSESLERSRVTARRAAQWVPRVHAEQRELDLEHARRVERSKRHHPTPPPVSSPPPSVPTPELDQPIVPPTPKKPKK